MSGNGILGIGVSALNVFRQSLETVSHNIANVNTDGYSRQQVQAGTTDPQFLGGSYIGTGVQVEDITRSYNQFVNEQLTDSTASNSRAQQYSDLSSQVDNLLSTDGSSLSPGLQQFFDALQTLSTDPTSNAARQDVISQGQALSGRFHSLNQQLDALGARTNGDIGNTVSDINTLAGNIAQINRSIVEAQAKGGTPNDLLDKRDALINKLANDVSVHTVAQDNGSVNVVIGKGLALVSGGNANTLETNSISFGGGDAGIGLKTPQGTTPVGNLLSGGKLGALVDFRGQVLEPAQNALGRIAIGLATSFNAQHAQGFDETGAAGGDFFSVPQPRAFADAGNTGSAGAPTVQIADASQLTTDDYQLRYDGSTWQLHRGADGQSVTLSGSGTASDPYTADGLSIQVPSGAAAGDSFTIEPTRQAAGDIGVAITDPSKIAAAGPDAAGTGSAGVGDNTNALALAGLQNQQTLAGGTASYGDAYDQLTTQVGTQTQAAQSDADTQSTLLTQAQNQRDSISGVNLDEEAASLLKYQKAYQASAQVIATANTLFQTLLSATRG